MKTMLRRSCNAMTAPRVDSTTDQAQTLQEKTSIIIMIIIIACEAMKEEKLRRWIFYLQGGGWCWNSTSCADRIDRNGNVGSALR